MRYNQIMMLILHILIAIASLVFTTYLYLQPTEAKFKPAYILVGATLLSGTYLVVSTNGHLLRTCTIGMIYLAVASYEIALARKKLVSSDTSE